MTKFILPVLFMISLLACEKPIKDFNDTTLAAFQNPSFQKVSIYDTLPGKNLAGIDINELHGMKVSYPSGKSTSYFEYDADPEQILRAITSLPFRRSEFADTLCRRIERPFSLSGSRVLSRDEVAQTSFFWNIQPEAYALYECIKGNQRHTLLVSNHSKHILHRIES